MEDDSQSNTIVALATPPGESAIAVVRASGPLCPSLVTSVFDRPLPPARRATLGWYRSRGREPLDQVLFTYFAPGHSYTGEAMLEISAHGNPYIARRILEDLIARGCSEAEPGEFTRTAFLNGQIDLSQAEAVIEMIRARSDAALAAARRQLEGSLGRAIDRITDQLLAASAHLEAYIDFPEEDLPPEDQSGPRSDLVAVRSEIERMVATRSYRDLLMDGATIVLVGRPNVGKSSLLNALVGEDRVLVSSEPGTTRDYIESRIQIGPFLARLTDTAGLRAAGQGLELRGMEHTQRLIEKADVVLVVIDLSSEAYPFDDTLLANLSGRPALLIENKIDLAPDAQCGLLPNIPHVRVSALTGTGITDLREALEELLRKNWEAPGENQLLVSSRHARALGSASEHLAAALSLLDDDGPAELAACEVRAAIDAVGHITGRIDNERMLDRLFQQFCIGK